MVYDRYTMQCDELSHMNAKQKRCFLKLLKMGVPVKIWHQNDPEYQDYRGYFWIDCEEEGAEQWFYYWEMYRSEEVETILDKAGLYAEWYNSAYLCVYDY